MTEPRLPTLDRPIVLVGMMGAGKTTVGRRLAQRLHLPFVDADAEIEAAACMSVPEIFAVHGEPHFRDGERRVIARLLKGGKRVIATGGGAFCDPRTRAAIAAEAISVWLKADPGLLLKRVSRRSNRPLLQTADPRGTLERLLAERAPLYALADVTVETSEAPPDAVADRVIQAIAAHLAGHRLPA